MNTPQMNYQGRLPQRPADTLYDYQICADESALSELLDEINYRRYYIVAVTQDAGGSYTVIFMRSTA